MTAAIFLAILLVDLVAAMSPGPTFVVAVRTAAVEGFRPAAGYALGVGVASAIWASAALFGLAIVFELAPALLLLLKLAGGGFLLWIAVETWRHADAPLAEPGADAVPRSLLAAVRLGLLTQLANPKSAVFYGSVFAGLVPHGGALGPLLALPAGIALLKTTWFALVARLFSLDAPRSVYRRVKGSAERLFGGLIAAFGIKIVAS